MCQNTNHFGVSSRLQEIVCLLAQDFVFEHCQEVLDEIMNISLSAKQVQRISEAYGQQLEQQHLQAAESLEAPSELPLKTADETVYAMLDGSMIFVKGTGWSEMKLGRLFTASSDVAVQPKRNQILRSEYVCHLGGHKQFLAKLEAFAELYRNKIFIADGARWIWNWVEDAYPDSVQILDFYHAMEKLSIYAGFQFGDESERKEWLKNKKLQLLQGGVGIVIEELNKTVGSSNQARKAKADVLRYYEANENRMRYDEYLKKGLLIGSGPVEAAHRTVVQQRLKLSGQRWSKQGAQCIVNLRACRKSKQWNKVINLITNAA